MFDGWFFSLFDRGFGVDLGFCLCSTEDQPAFNHEYEYVRGRKLGVIKLNPEVAKHFATGGSVGTLHPRHLPMLVPPKPWIAHDVGAYMYNKSTSRDSCSRTIPL